MSDIATQRYGHAPAAAFAATRASAEQRRARETAAPVTLKSDDRPSRAKRLFHRLATILTGASS